MKTRNLFYLTALLLVCIGLMPCSAADKSELDSWHKIQDSGVTIEFQSGLGPLARLLMPEAIKLAQNGPQVLCEREINKLTTRKHEILRFITKQLDMDKPSKESASFFDIQILMASAYPSSKYIKLWHRQSLKEAVLTGKSIRGVLYDTASDKFRTHRIASASDQLPGSEGQPTVVAPAPISIPIDLGVSKPQLDQALEYMNDYLQIIQLNRDLHTFFHEITELTLCNSTSLYGCFRRWFCDGVANYVAGQCLGKFAGKPALEEYLAEQTLCMRDFAPLRTQVDLLNWKAIEWENDLPRQMRGELSDAHYFYATYEIRELAKRYGTDVLPKICRELRKTRAEEGMEILDAISKVTGEDFTTHLSIYGTESCDEFKGFGFIKFMAAGISGNNEYQLINDHDMPIIEIDKDGGIAGVVYCASLNYPLEVKWEISGASSARWVNITNEKPKNIPAGGVAFKTCYTMEEPFSSGKFKPGDNTLSLYVQGKLVKQVKFKLVAA